MRSFKSIFGHPSEKSKNTNPDNEKLFSLIEQYIQDNKYESYKQVVEQVRNIKSSLLILVFLFGQLLTSGQTTSCVLLRSFPI